MLALAEVMLASVPTISESFDRLKLIAGSRLEILPVLGQIPIYRSEGAQQFEIDFVPWRHLSAESVSERFLFYAVSGVFSCGQRSGPTWI